MRIRLLQRASMKRNYCSRRSFLKISGAALGAAAFSRPLILSGAEAGSTAANSKLNLALVGCGGQGRGVMRGLLSSGANLVALCDPDQGMIGKARADALKSGGEATKDAKAYEDYRRLLDDESSFDAVLVGTPDPNMMHRRTFLPRAAHCSITSSNSTQSNCHGA